jgi:vanadium nitrogenase delta subunit
MIKTQNEKVKELFLYVQERCLWQFFSRAKDRETNINTITQMAGELLTGKKPVVETPMDKQCYADAIELVVGLKTRVPWILSEPPEAIPGLMDELKEELLDLAVKSATNGELTWSFY